MTPSGPVIFSVARRRVLVGPRSLPRTRRQDASNSVSTTDVARHEHPPKHPLRRPSAERPWENPPELDVSDHPRTCGVSAEPRATPDHLAVIRPPTAFTLDGVLPASGRSTVTFMLLARGEGRASLLYRLAAAPSDRNPLTSLAAAGSGSPKQSFSSRVNSFLPGHVNAPDAPEPEMPSTGEDRASALARARRGALSRWPTRTAAARVHRCSRTSTRPLFTRFRV